MNLNVSQINAANASIKTTIEASEIAKKEEIIAKKFAQKAKIDGFRPGKTPVAVVKKRFAQQIKQEAEQELLQLLLKDGLKDLNKDSNSVVGEPFFKKFDRNGDNIELELHISFKPSIDLTGFEECIPTYSTPRVTKKDIDAKKEYLFKLVAPLKTIEDNRGIEEGDFVMFDFEGFLDGKPFDGGKAENYTLEIGSGQFIPGFEESMKGLKVGEKKDLELKFPENYGSKDLAGKEVIFKVKIHEIKAKEVPSEADEEMLKKLLPQEEKPSDKKLEEEIKKQIKMEKLDALYEDELKPKFVENIVEKFNFDLPENIIEQEIDMQFRSNLSSFNQEDFEKLKNDPEEVKKKREEYREDAIKSVKLTFIVDELARQKEIVVADQEVMQRIYFEALQTGQNPKAYMEMYQKQGLLPAIKMAMIEEKLFKSLFFKNDTEEEK